MRIFIEILCGLGLYFLGVFMGIMFACMAISASRKEDEIERANKK